MAEHEDKPVGERAEPSEPEAGLKAGATDGGEAAPGAGPTAATDEAGPPPAGEAVGSTADGEAAPGAGLKAGPTPRGGARRIALGIGALLLAIVAGVLVSVLTVDLGPTLKGLAERRGSQAIQRTMHIGRLSAKLTPGVFEVEDLVIEGLTPTDRPFLKAKKITVGVAWSSIFTRKPELVVDWVEMTDWEMVIESFPNGRHNFPKFTRDRKEPRQPGRFTTTVKSVLASRGRFTYVDHGTPWSIATRDLRVHVYRTLNDYQGDASFGGSTIRIQAYEPFGARMRTHFKIEPPMLRMTRIDLVSDGATTVLDGEIDLSRWPEQIYRMTSQLDFRTQKNIFFHREKFAASGTGEFKGTFHLYKGGREVKGQFTSPLAGVDIGGTNWSFPNLRGSVRWLPDRLEITDTTSGLYGGTARFDYRLAPIGKRVPTIAVWDVTYRDVDLSQLTDLLGTSGIRIAGRASGRNRLEWPLGKWSQKRGDGEVTAQAPPGVPTMTRALDPDLVAQQYAHPQEAGPFNPNKPLGYVPVAGHVRYRLDPAQIELGDSWVATPKTYVEFNGRTAYGLDSYIPFHVTSLDWQESDRVLAGIMTAFGAPTSAVEIGGHGEFDGVMLKSFTKPRITGLFSGDHMRAWDVNWGQGRAKVVIENGYVDVADSSITSGNSEIKADGRFALGYPRKDGGEEINARVFLVRRPLAELRHAFLLDDWPIDGLVSGEYHLYGKYETPFGYGRLQVDDGVAYGEKFDAFTANLRFEGSGVRVDALNMTKGTGTITGAAWVGWEGEYSFNADGRRIPVESLQAAQFPLAPLSGVLRFTASGTGTFDEPRYDVTAQVDDLFAADEGIGTVKLGAFLRGELMNLELNAASPRLIASGSGRIALTDEMDAEMTLRFQDTSLDPYLRILQPKLSPFTTAIAGGTVRIVGELVDPEHLLVDATVEKIEMKLFDYALANDGPIELSLEQRVAKIGRLRLVGEGTQLEVGGQLDLRDSTIDVQANGDANLGILQGTFRNIRSSGAATLRAAATGSLEDPVFSGNATIENGRIRHALMPHSLESINGRVSFDEAGIRLDDVKARLGGGAVTFGGRVAMEGFQLGDFSLTATGEQMRLRYPEGFRSVIDADLTLRGDMSALLLSGTVTVHDALYSKRFDPNAGLLTLTGGAASPAPGPAAASTLPLRFDIQVDAPSTLRVENNLARIVSSADLRLQGTYDKPLLFGRATIDRGDLIFEGNRYVITRGTIGFANPTRIEPYFDVEAETRVRVPGETYRVTLGFTGTTTNSTYAVNSDPPLSIVDTVALLLGQTSGLENAELRALNAGASTRAEEDLLKAATARLLTGTVAAPVSRAVEQTFGINFQIAPTIGSEADPLTPSARVTLGRRLSNRVYITFTRALGASSREQIIVLEYDQNDRVGWILSQNGDRTTALEFRVRHIF